MKTEKIDIIRRDHEPDYRSNRSRSGQLPNALAREWRRQCFTRERVDTQAIPGSQRDDALGGGSPESL